MKMVSAAKYAQAERRLKPAPRDPKMLLSSLSSPFFRQRSLRRYPFRYQQS